MSAPHGWTKRTKRSASQRATAFAEWCTSHGLATPAQLTSRVLGLWREQRLKAVSAATVNRDEDVLRKCFRWAAEQSPPLCAPAEGLVKRRRLRESKRAGLEVVPSPAECELIAQAFGSDPAQSAPAPLSVVPSTPRIRGLSRDTHAIESRLTAENKKSDVGYLRG